MAPFCACATQHTMTARNQGCTCVQAAHVRGWLIPCSQVAYQLQLCETVLRVHIAHCR
jgi:hypothetical protein